MITGWHSLKNQKNDKLSHYMVGGKSLCGNYEVIPWLELKDTRKHCVLCQRFLEKQPRNEEIRQRRRNGEQVKVLADDYNLPKSRISVITRDISPRKVRSDKK